MRNMDAGLPERLRQMKAECGLEAAHEGDSTVYMRLVDMCQVTTDEIRKPLLREKVDLAYTRYAITLDQWSRLYNILGGRDPDHPITQAPPAREDNDACVFPTQHTVFLRRNGTHSNYKDAVLQNDEAHKKTIREVVGGEIGDRQESFKEIQREAKMWLRHLDVIHGRINTQ